MTTTYMHDFGMRQRQKTMFLPSINSRPNTRCGGLVDNSRVRRIPFTPTALMRSKTLGVDEFKALKRPSTAYINRINADIVPTIFPAARNSLYTKFTPDEWHRSNFSHYNASDKIRDNAERLREEAIRLAKEKDSITHLNNVESSKKLGERIADIAHWKEELEREKQRLLQTIKMVEDKKKNLEKVLADTEGPLKIAKENLYEREKRQGIDMVHDNVEQELMSEVDVIRLNQERLMNDIEQCKKQLGMNRAILHELERDSMDKFRAKQLDESAHGLTNTSKGIQHYNGIESSVITVNNPVQWMEFTEENIRRSQMEREASDQLAKRSDETMNQVIEEIWKQHNRTNVALDRRVHEVQHARNNLQNHLNKILNEIFDLEKNLELLRKTMNDKEQWLKVAETRLEVRNHRPNVELTADNPSSRLIHEVDDLKQTLSELYGKVRQGENALQHLLRQKVALEHDLGIKNNSLFIDRDKCLGVRKTLNMSSPANLATTVAYY
ncbi:hypothetical protein SNEBB_009728 [Seison nebaliae]|nr:hypothetical protein SNEBB_009728 [Seison nebaliae]